MTGRNNEVNVVENIWKKVCEAQTSIDEDEYRQMKKSLDLFVARGNEQEDYMWLLGCLEAADIGKKFPKIVGELVVALYEYALDMDPDPVIINNFGSLYYNGRLGEIDYEKAMKYYDMADKAGCTIATKNLAYHYYYGFGTEVNYELAFKYFTKAALLGRYGAMAKLGDMYRYGYYVEKDPKMVFKCYTKALSMVKTDNEEFNKAFGSMLYRVADAYYEGIGVKPSLGEAMQYYHKAELALYEQIENGDKYNLDKLYYVIARQQEIREKFSSKLPSFEY